MMGAASVLHILEGRLLCMAALCSKLDDTMDVSKWAQSRSSTVLKSESSFVCAEEGDCVVVPPGMAFSVTAMTEVAVAMHVPQLHMEMLRAHVDPQDLASIRARLAADLENMKAKRYTDMSRASGKRGRRRAVTRSSKRYRIAVFAATVAWGVTIGARGAVAIG